HSLPGANLGHAFEWKQVMEKAYRKRTCYLAATRSGQWLGILPLVHMRGPLTGNRLVSLPFLDQAGILAASPEAEAALLEAATRFARESGARGIDFRSQASTEPGGSRGPERATLVLPLLASPDDLWKSFSPKVRNQVRKAEKEGLTTEAVEARGLDEFYPVFARNMRDLGSPVHARRFFEMVLEAFGTRAKLYVTRDGQKRAVGGAIALLFRDTVTVPWASSLREAFPSCPNHSLYWKVLSRAVEEGARLFDFGRSHVDSGTYKFKTQWGAQPISLLWTSLDPLGRKEAQKVYKPAEHQRLTSLWSRLPVWLASWLGPRVRRQLSN
ncbi:MAG TPA: FemAB family XrtA/PEP-CTERM system-associated protein, partial [Planctomycetota bacterium]|nr:FemAB family XrtA/PEP-CTERM system-associated protein [Planctomycetota bacterium]